MNKLIKIPLVAAGAGAGLFAASLVVYYFYLSKWYDHIERRPFNPPKEVF